MRITLFAIALLFTSLVNAQVGTGLFVGGQLGFSTSGTKYKSASSTTDGTKYTSFSIIPRVGYFFTDNIGAGIVVGYSADNSNNEAFNTKTALNTLVLGLFGRYALPLGDEGNFAVIGDLNLGYGSTTGWSKTTLLGTTVTSKYDPESTITVGIAPGILFFPTPKIGLEANIGNIVQFRSTTTTDANDNDNKAVETSFEFLSINTLGFNFGFNYYFSR